MSVGSPPPVKIFLSTPSVRRATAGISISPGGDGISIHALREEGDYLGNDTDYKRWAISIHALREEGDGFAKS